MGAVQQFVPVTLDTLGGVNIPSWFQTFLIQYNAYGKSSSDALSGALVLESNIVGMYYPASGYLKVSTGANYTNGVFTPISFGWLGYQFKSPSEVRIGLCQQQNGKIITNPLTISSWSYSSTTRAITINYITGLANSTAYFFTFAAQ
jgi:hypothetical protein